MSGYIDFPLVTDENELAVEALEFLTESIPGWVPREGHLEVWMIEVWARMLSENRIVAAQVPREIFRYFGQSLLGLMSNEAAAATALTQWTMIDSAGYTIPLGTVVGYRIAGDELVPFETVEDVVISPGSLTASDVLIQAVEEGSASSGLGPTGLELVDALAFVDTVTSSAPSSGGVDAEDEQSYLDRLTAELRLLTPRPILPQDFAVLARRVSQVARAVGIDLYDPDLGTWDNERTVSVAIIDADGQALDSTVKDEVKALLDAEREVNFVVHVIDPAYTTVDVVAEFTLMPGFEPSDTVANVELALSQYLSPASWAGGDETPPIWRAESGVVRYLEVASLINSVPGVDYLTVLTVNTGTADVNLTGVAPLPQAGTIAVTVAAP
ncbi:MAG: baseplate J/gp47 family protein [Dermatophilaceae bacterium]|nr:baseplate J/gp47 family protein [Intrasporangiaceae bacterium]